MPRILGGTGWASGHIGTLCLVDTKVSDAQKGKKNAWHKPHCTNSLGTISHSYQLRDGGNPSKIQVPGHQLRARLASRPFQG